VERAGNRPRRYIVVCVQCREDVENESVKRTPWVIHNVVHYLPAVAAAMLAIFPSPTTQGIVLYSSFPKQC
jgi:hypothetical protein